MDKNLLFAMLFLVSFSLVSGFVPMVSYGVPREVPFTCNTLTDLGNGLTRCFVDGGSNILGAAGAGELLRADKIIGLGRVPTSGENVVLVLHNVFFDYDDVDLEFSGFHSISFEGGVVHSGQRTITIQTSNDINFSRTPVEAHSLLRVAAPFVNVSGGSLLDGGQVLIQAPSVIGTVDSVIHATQNDVVISPGSAASSSSGVGVNFQGLLNATFESPSLLGGVRWNSVYVLAPNAPVTLGPIDASNVTVQGSGVQIGFKTGSPTFVGRGGTVAIVSSGKFTEDHTGVIRGANVSIYSSDSMDISGVLSALSFSGSRGKLLLAGGKSLSISSTGSLRAADYGGTCPFPLLDGTIIYIPCLISYHSSSISLLFPSGNVVIAGAVDSYNSRTDVQGKLNGINITGSNVFIQNGPLLSIKAGDILSIRGSSISIPNEVVSPVATAKIKTNLAGSVEAGVNPVVLYTCSSSGIPASYVPFIRYDASSSSSLCPSPIPINVYGYLANGVGHPYLQGAANVTSVRVASPGGAFITSTTGGNVTALYPSLFTSSNPGFFSFVIPGVPLSPGAYQINMVFSTNSSFNCSGGTAGACDSRVAVVNVPSG